MKRLLFGLMAIVMVAGCSTTPQAVANPGVSFPAAPSELADKTWISPGIVEVKDYYDGATAEWAVRIHNGKETPATFNVSYKTPNYVKDGFAMPSILASAWVTFSQNTVIIPAQSYVDVSIALNMPPGYTNAAPKWEFWVSVVESSTAMVQTELVSRWQITMK